MMATAPALWNQLRFNTDQPPALANLVSGPAGTRPGAVMLGPDTERQFVFADAPTLELAQRLARRDIQKMREPPTAPTVHSRAVPVAPQPEARSVRPVQRLCKDPGRLRRPTPAAATAEERRIKQQQQLRKRREEEEAELQRRREQREKERREKAVRTAPDHPLRASHSLQQQQQQRQQELPVRGDSPPVRDTDPQVKEIKEQQLQLMGMLKELIRMKPAPPMTRRPVQRPLPTRQRGYLSETRASKGRQQRQTRRRPCERRQELEDNDDDDEFEVARPMRLLNAMPGPPRKIESNSAVRRDHPGSARDRTSVLRQQLSQRLQQTPSPNADSDTVTNRLADLLMDEVIGDTAWELQRSQDSASPLPGYTCDEEVLEPTVDEVDFRLQQIEAEYDAIRARWRCLDYEELPPAPEDGMVDTGPLVLDNNAILFTKQPEVSRWQHQQPVVDKRRLVPRPPTHVAVGLSRAALHSISNARQRFLDWSNDRPGPRFSVEMATVADWICADLVDEALTGAVQDVDRAGEDIVNVLLEAEMGGGVGYEEEGSTLADGDGGSASTFESESSEDDD